MIWDARSLRSFPERGQTFCVDRDGDLYRFSRATEARKCAVPASSTMRSLSFGSRIIQPPKLSPLGRSNDLNLTASFRKLCGDYSAR